MNLQKFQASSGKFIFNLLCNRVKALTWSLTYVAWSSNKWVHLKLLIYMCALLPCRPASNIPGIIGLPAMLA